MSLREFVGLFERANRKSLLSKTWVKTWAVKKLDVAEFYPGSSVDREVFTPLNI